MRGEERARLRAAPSLPLLVHSWRDKLIMMAMMTMMVSEKMVVGEYYVCDDDSVGDLGVMIGCTDQY